MGKDVAEIRREHQARLGQVARELTRELYPDGLPRGTKFSELEDVAGAMKNAKKRPTKKNAKRTCKRQKTPKGHAMQPTRDIHSPQVF